MSDIHIISIITLVFGMATILHILCRKKPYTTEEWNNILEEEFKKHGPVPEDKN
ncbi:hypothetical protein [Algibacter sp. PT7-4]|uniref:hypothetical protein n=1 Tax=Algibacter ulvanivorans TaxID=3400999 RepID=UPI003AACF68E